jgi:hypothetical protein
MKFYNSNMDIIYLKKQKRQGYFSINLIENTCSCSRFSKNKLCPHIEKISKNLEEYLNSIQIINLYNAHHEISSKKN